MSKVRKFYANKVYQYRWKGLDMTEEERKKLIPADIVSQDPAAYGMEFPNEGLFMYLHVARDAFGNTWPIPPAPFGYAMPFPKEGFKGQSPEEYVAKNYARWEVVMPMSSFTFSDLEVPSGAGAGAAGAGAGPGDPLPDPCIALLESLGIKTESDFRKWALENHPDKGGDEETFKRVSGCFNRKGGRRKTKKNRRRRKNTRKRV